MKIALIQCPVWGTYDPPVALAQLSACLKREGHEVCVFDLNIKLYRNRTENYKNMWAWEQSLFWYDAEQVKKFFRDNEDDIRRYAAGIVKAGARIVGFSVSAASWLASIELAKRLKDIDNRLIIVFGGPLFFERRYVDSILKEAAVDIVIPGEGEVTFCELAGAIENNNDISCCKGIAFKKDGEIIKTQPRKLLANLDDLPFLDFSDLPLKDYDDSRHIPFMASRGCVQTCAFCSSRTFWPGYRAMSGERMFREFEFHKKTQGRINPDFGHIDFLDLLVNGNMESLNTFCDLMGKARLNIYWSANMIIRPEMTPDVISKMKEAGCEHVIFGIESGSQRVLNLMKKHYRIQDADRIIRWLHEAGILVTCNFMFGFPGETEEDFKETLDFIRRNAGFLGRVYPSRTFCAIEEYSYFHGHLEEFGVKPNPPNHLYWESMDGESTYPVRLERCEQFCNLALSLGIEVGCGVQTSVELDKWHNLGFYYEAKKDYKNAMDCFLKYNKLDSANEVILNKINLYCHELKESR
ncbi:MAG: radical SAM protein [Candidatus Omnitrophica bacterium]|nr:radical SAM protein [Candidatus Omnitrophota bacterium]